MFKNHQGDDITVRRQIRSTVKAIFQVRHIVACGIVDRPGLLRGSQSKVADMSLITMSPCDIPAAPALIQRTLVCR